MTKLVMARNWLPTSLKQRPRRFEHAKDMTIQAFVLLGLVRRSRALGEEMDETAIHCFSLPRTGTNTPQPILRRPPSPCSCRRSDSAAFNPAMWTA